MVASQYDALRLRALRGALAEDLLDESATMWSLVLARTRSDDEPQRAREILEYFVRNPRAADDLEEVVRWRLHEEQVRRSVDEIRAALGWLVRQGYLVERAVPGADPIFSLNEAKTGAARRLITPPGRRRQRKRMTDRIAPPAKPRCDR